MKGFLTQLKIQCKSDLRNRTVLWSTYVVPVIYYVLNGYLSKLTSRNSELILNSVLLAISLMAYSLLPQKFVALSMTGTQDTYRVLGIPAWSYHLIAIILALFHNIIFTVGILFFAPVTFNARIPENLFLFFIVMIVCAVSSMSIGMFFSSIVHNTSATSLFSTLLLIPSIIDVSVFPSGLKTLISFFPSHLAKRALVGDFWGSTFIMCVEAIFFILVSQLIMSKLIKKK